MKTITVHRAFEMGIAMLLLAVTAFPAQMDSRLGQMQQQMNQLQQAQRQNAEALRQYTWKSRKEMRKGEETKTVQLSVMRYDANGSLQKTPISSSPQQQLPTHGIRDRRLL